MKEPALLEVEGLRVGFRNGDRITEVVSGIDFSIRPGETFALVGESGSGKSISALAVTRLLPLGGRILAGKVRLEGEDLLQLPEFAMGNIRGGRVGMIFQDPMSSLNPVMPIGRQITEVLQRHGKARGKNLRARARELLGQVGLPRPDAHLSEFPHQLSGGMRQRAMIAIALAGEPTLLIADEPTTALDVTIQAQILDLLKSLQCERGMALWLITHDLGIVADIADQVAVMRHGDLVEEAAAKAFFERPRHPYSRQLFDAMPRMDACRGRISDTAAPILLEVRDFRVHYPIRKGILQRTVGHVRAVDGVSFQLAEGQTLALVGESGCGKTTLGKGLLQLIDVSGGEVRFGESPSASLERRERCAAQQIIFQDPMAAMNPRMIVGEIVAEGLRSLRSHLSEIQIRATVEELLASVGLPADAWRRYPHEFSGGQRQRICIARALAVEPKLVICDEPTSALDVSVQKQIIGLLKSLQQRGRLSYLFITHDLAVVAELADRVAVMEHGRIVEVGDVEQVLYRPRHPYTEKLLAAVPKLRWSPRREMAML